MMKIPYPAAIKSYALRQGRITNSQQQALKSYWQQFGLINGSEPLDFESVFGRQAPTLLEIGFGNGESFLKQAIENPEFNFIGIEVHTPGVANVLREAQQLELTNVRLFQHDAVEVLSKRIPNSCLEAIQIFFPDPWPKRRHHKRRLIQPHFIALLVQKLKRGGRLHCATDWENYAIQMMKVLSDPPGLINIAGENCYFLDPYSLRPNTKFENRGKQLGYQIRDLVFQLNH